MRLSRHSCLMTGKPPPPSNKVPPADAGAQSGRGQGLPAEPQRGDVAEFLAKVKALAPGDSRSRGRLIFAMDATMSREPTWDLALGLQADMFGAVKDAGGLDVQLVYFRGVGECRASKWVSNPDALARLMATVRCHGGFSQIGKVLVHARSEAEKRKVHALVYVGDAVEEDVDGLCARAGELGLLGVPVFLFQEGDDPSVHRAFGEIARLTKGATFRFDRAAAGELRQLLSAVAVYAAGGQRAVTALARGEGGHGARLLLSKLKPGS
jgi:hypothetical protein